MINSEILNVEEIGFVIKIIIGFLVGALIGLERERTRLISAHEKPRSLPGLRSFGLLSLYGTIVAHIATTIDKLGYYVFQIFALSIFSSMIVLLMALYMYQRTRYLKRTGITTYIVMGLDLGLGILVGIGKILEAISASILITFILAVKPSIEKFVKGISYRELLSGLELGLFLFILGPIFLLKPIVIMGFDLSKLYLLFIIILVLSFVSYVGVKIKGGEALKYISFLGGLVNSEASAANIASILSSQESIDIGVLKNIAKRNMLIIIAAMLIRNLIIVSMLSLSSLNSSQSLTIITLTTLSFAPAVILGAVAWIFERGENLKGIRVNIENPISINTAIRIVVVYASIFLISYILYNVFGLSVMYVIATVGGFVNAGATILTLFALSGIGAYNEMILVTSIILTNLAAIFNKILYVHVSAKNRAILLSCIHAVLLTSILTAGAFILVAQLVKTLTCW